MAREHTAPSTQPDEDKGAADLRTKLLTIGGGIITAILVIVGAFYIFGLSLPEGWSSGGATPIAIDQRIAGEFSTFRATQLYEFAVAERVEVTVMARSDEDIYVELQRDNRPFDRGVNILTAALEPGTYQVFVRPQRQGSGAFTLVVTTPDHTEGPAAAPPAAEPPSPAAPAPR